MRLFNAQLFDRRIEGNGAIVIASAAWSSLLARAEALKFFCVVDQVSPLVPAPTLTVGLLGSGEASFTDNEVTIVIPATALNAGTNLLVGAYSPANTTYPPPKHLVVEAELDGTDAVAHARLWVCGRGPQLLETGAPSTATFAAQLAAARACADEDRMVGRKRVLRPGASYFYPPEMFEPTLKWDR